jgi:hypothetical protein
MNWVDLAQDRKKWRVILNAVMDLRVPLNVKNLLNSLRVVNFSRWTLLQGVNYPKFPGRLRKTTDAVSLVRFRIQELPYV